MLSRDRYTRLASVFTPETMPDTIRESSLPMKQLHTPQIDDWLAEAALWVEWDHLGLLVALSPASIITLDCCVARRIIRTSSHLHKRLRCCALLFAQQLDMLGGFESPEVTDLSLPAPSLRLVGSRASRFC